MREAIRRHALELGFDDCRFANAAPPHSASQFREWLALQRHGQMAYLERNALKREDPRRVLPGVQTVIALAASYAEEGQATPGAHRGLVARYARYADYHDILGRRLKDLAGFVDQLGSQGTRSLGYVDTGPVLERDLAQRAGVGFIGKHTNVISRQFGNWIFLSEVLTTLELEPDPPERNRCGSCARCIAACPTGAIRAPFQLDARLCISYLTIELKGPIPIELRPAIGNRIFGCDDCLAACPWNRFAREGQLMRPHPRPDLATPALLDLVALDEPGFRRLFAGTPMLRARREGLLRNVCVALGNTAGTSALAALEKAAADPNPIIAEHARWACGRIGARGLPGGSIPGSLTPA
ncbi:MAG: tRNA epoxyqueuosine(34) reductase QueG [Limisphaerales bacterium]